MRRPLAKGRFSVQTSSSREAVSEAHVASFVATRRTNSPHTYTVASAALLAACSPSLAIGLAFCLGQLQHSPVQEKLSAGRHLRQNVSG